jgi:hypothetical protein
MKNANWIKGAVSKHPGALHRNLGIPEGQKIPPETLASAAGRPGVVGREARLAQTLARLRKGKL